MRTFIAHSVRDREIVAALANIMREAAHEVSVAGEIVAAGDALSAVSEAIRSADVLVGILTSGNVNIFYELGMAAGANVPILIAAPAGALLPADLASVPYVQLTGDTLRDAQTIARRATKLQGAPSTKPTMFESAEMALRVAARDRALLDSLSASDFDRLVVDLFKVRGYTVGAAPPTQTTHVDFAMESQENKGLVLVELKKVSSHSRVSVTTVVALLAAVTAAEASLGLLVATSGYTAAACAFAVGRPVVLRTLEEILNAKSQKELLELTPRAAKSVCV